MAKYSGCLTSGEVGRFEAREVMKILRKYNVPKDVRKEIAGMVYEGYFQLSEVCKSEKEYRKYLKEIHGLDIESEKYIKGFIPWMVLKSPSEWLRNLFGK